MIHTFFDCVFHAICNVMGNRSAERVSAAVAHGSACSLLPLIDDCNPQAVLLGAEAMTEPTPEAIELRDCEKYRKRFAGRCNGCTPQLACWSKPTAPEGAASMHYEFCPHDKCERTDCYGRCMDDPRDLAGPRCSTPPLTEEALAASRAHIDVIQFCHDLARAFLSDAGFTDPKLIHQLVQEVQQTVENFIGALESERDA